MTITGHPDFLDYPSWMTPDVTGVAYPVTFTPGLHSGSILPVAHYGSVLFRANPSSGQGKAILQWYEDAAGVNGVGTDSWPVNNGTSLLVAMPTEGPFVQWQFNNTGAGNAVVNMRLRFTNTSLAKPSYPITQDGQGGFAFTIPASGQQNYTMGWIHSGRALLAVKPYDAAGKLDYKVFTQDEAGIAHLLLYQQLGPVAFFETDFPVTDTIMSVHVTNNDAVSSHQYDLAFVPQIF